MNANRLTVPGSDWHEQVQEKVLEPDIPIVDPHHHLWRRLELDYLLEDLQNDTQSGHDIRKTVFVECSASYRDSGPEHLKPVGETEFVAEIAEESKEQSKPLIAGIVAHADLTLGASVEEVLEAHEGAGRGLFRGIRHALAHSKHPEHMTIVIQHQYAELQVNDDHFSITLFFGGKPSPMIIPFQAITSFNDPSVGFGLQFGMLDDGDDDEDRLSVDDGGSAAVAKNHNSDDTSGHAGKDTKTHEEKTAEVVSLDTFRKRPTD